MNENYKGSIELISGLKQKNNLDFPLMEASAVAFYEEVTLEDGSTSVKEIRLPEKLKSVGISKDEKEQLIQEAVSQAQNVIDEDLNSLNTRVGATEGSVYTLTSQVSELAEQVKKGDNPNLRLQYEKQESTLYLYEDPEDKNGLIKPNPETGEKGNVISATTIEAGKGGVTLPYRLTLKKLSDLKAARLGDKVSIKTMATMLQVPGDSEEGDPYPITKELTFRLTVSSESKGTLTSSFKHDTNEEFDVDLTSFLGLGSNEVTLSTSYTEDLVSDEGEVITKTIFSSQSWKIKMVELSLTSSFVDATEFINRTAAWSGTAIGDIIKTIHYELNGEPWKTETRAEVTANLNMTIPFLGHGVYSLDVYATAEINGADGNLETISSEKLHYELLFVDRENPSPILRLKVTPNPMKQYSAGVIDYTVYSNLSVMKKVELYEGENLLFSGSISNAAQSHPYTFMDFGEKTITLKYGEYTKVINFTVEEAEYQINPVISGLVLDFLPTGRSNSASDYNVFYNNALNVVDADAAATIPDITWEFSENFDWNNGGWQVDAENNTYFCVKAGTEVKINYDMFKDSTIISSGQAAGSGKEFKLIFKATNVGSPDATFLSCLEDTIGLQMNVHEAYISSNETKIYSPYSENDIIEFDFNIFPGVNDGISLKPFGEPFNEIIPMTMTYEDGTPFQPSVHTMSTSYEHSKSQPIIIGSPDCDVHIYRMKVYNRYLTDKEVLTNFVADARNGEDMVDRHIRNLIYDAGRLTPNSLAKARPDLKIIKITCPKFTNHKSDFMPMTSVEMIHKNGDPILDNWIFEDCFIVGQGTTSNNYRDAGKNLELICCFDGKYKNKKILNDYYGGDSSKYYKHRTKLTLNPRDENPNNRIDNSYDATLEENPGDGRVTLHRNAYPNNYFNIKVNIASSENANNAIQANRYDRYLPYDTPAKRKDSRIKTTMDFVNCVVFLCETDPSGIEFPPSQTITQPSDLDYHFYAIGNIGDSKKTDAERAYDVDDDKEFVVEILDNDKPNAAFPTGFMKENMEYIYPITREQWEATDGYKKVDALNVLIDKNLPIFYELVDGKYIKTEDETIDPEKTYYEINYLNSAYESLYINKYRLTDKGEIVQFSGWAASFEMRYGDDSDENIEIWNQFYEWLIFSSNKDFIAEFSNWFIKNAALYYYLFTERYTMMDNRAKNSFWHWAKFYITEEEAVEMGEKANYYTIDNEAAAIHNGYRFDFWDYDNDTALGIDNNGQIKFEYGLEDSDTNPNGTFVFNAGNSVFFRRIKENFSADLTTVYNMTDEAWDPEGLIQEYDKWQSEFPEALWLEDTKRKYYRTYIGKELNHPSLTQGWLSAHLTARMQGRKKYHRRQWERDQADYMDSKYATNRAVNKKFMMRCKTPPNPVVPYNYTWKLKPYKKMYLQTYLGDHVADSIRALDLNKIYELNVSDTEITDAQVSVISANCIQDFGDLSTFYAYQLEPGAGTERVKNLVVGNATPGYKNDELVSVAVGSANILKTLNIQNLRKVTSLALVPSLEYLYAQGSGLTNATFPKGGFIKEAYLPDTINTLKAIDLYYLDTLTLDSYDNLKVLLIDKCKQITSKNLELEIVNNAVNLERVKLTDINWELSDGTLLNRLLKLGGFAEDNITPINQSVLSGKVHLGFIRAAEKAAYEAAWPELHISFTKEIEQHSLIFKNEDEVIYSVLKDLGTKLTEEDDPYLNGAILKPMKPDSEDGQFEYIYNGWRTATGDSFIGTIVNNTDIIFHAFYTQKTKEYTVTWHNDTAKNSPIFAQRTVLWGENAVLNIPADQPQFPSKPTAGDNVYYLFDKWDKTSTQIKQHTDIYPIWLESNPYLLMDKPFEELTAADIYGLQQTNTLNNKYKNPGETLVMQMGYMPTFEGMEEEVLIEEKTVFDGKTTAINTGIKLLQEDSSFTLAIDFEMGYNGGTLMSCIGTSNAPSLTLESAKGKIPNLKWINEIHPVGFIEPTETRTHREIFVIRKIKGSNTVYIYTNNRFSLTDLSIIETQKTDLANAINANPLTFGARIDSLGKFSNYGSGVIHYAKLWYGDVGAEECKKICSWIYEKREFDFVGQGFHNYADSDIFSQGTFVARELLDEEILFGTISTDKMREASYGGSAIRKWLQAKPFLGASLSWQQTIPSVEVRSLKQKSTADSQIPTQGPLYREENNSIPTDRFYLPGATNLDEKIYSNSVYSNEAIGGSPYLIFTDNESRIKNNSLTKQPVNYWTRTPYYLGWSNQTLYGVGGSTNEDQKGTLHYYHNLPGSSSTSWYYNDGSSNTKAGVLLVFSI